MQAYTMYKKLPIVLFILWTCNSCSKKHISNTAQAEEAARFIVYDLDKPSVINYFPKQHFNHDRVKELIKRMRACDWSSRECSQISSGMGFSGGQTWASFGYACTSACGEITFTLTFNTEHQQPALINVKIEESLGKEN